MGRVVEHHRCGSGVVVGDDGSAAARDALLWAAEDARRRQTTLHVIRAWTMTSAPRPRDWSPGYVSSLEELEGACRDVVHSRVAEVLGDQPGLDVQVTPVHGKGVPALVEAATGADLLVVGFSGRGGVRGMVLGSTAEHLVREAPCPVVIVRPKRPPR